MAGIGGWVFQDSQKSFHGSPSGHSLKNNQHDDQKRGEAHGERRCRQLELGAPTGIGTRGPGEQQLEIDRRIVQRKMADLRGEIKEIHARKEREVAKRNQDYFTAGLVGYTNAGKSTLFNTATGADTYADDKLFATLSTKTRRWDLGDGDTVMLSDTRRFRAGLAA